uniref:Uncharacterized protein n=1 Tax=Anguilla anguilla TaxID=7936 RepID=A0A0E9U5A5_ANGAN
MQSVFLPFWFGRPQDSAEADSPQ